MAMPHFLDCHSSLSALAPLQRVLNAAARLVCNLRPREHVTSALIDLHWLPVAARIELKICVLAYVPVIGQYCTSIHFRHAAAMQSPHFNVKLI